MFCPQCGNEAREPYKFCKLCGANLSQVKQAMTLGPGETLRSPDVVDYGKAYYEHWKEELKRQWKKTPEEKRLEEIKAGVITTCVGIGVSLFMYFLLTAVAAGEPDKDAAILYVVRWIGFIPLLIGLSILFNALVISKRLVELKKKRTESNEMPAYVPAIDTSPMQRLAQPAEPAISDFSVTETTTTKLREPVTVQSERSSETN
ncbi:MAG: zinc ribbon domain-containing protein [Acidobacteriota bacterium]|nr:MAG: zinc ribbon domain-containing protein [Acidobacteriota bacterium]